MENKEKTVLFFSNDQQTDYESEEYENDVRYQNRTEITLDCERKNVIKGYFILKSLYRKSRRSTASFSSRLISLFVISLECSSAALY